ncbi:alpha-lactalbumin [Macrotis lagotis]|uniref:alpha-lactalbumin n=1 Tax=Macrotis lagotis TaxID=92651 RepID=UPI003D684B01
MMSLLPLLLLSIVLPTTPAKNLNKCEFIQKVREQKLDSYVPMPEFTCTIFHSTGFSTHNKVDNNGNTEYGIFQISNNGWCAEKQEDVAKSVCGIHCSKFLDEDITDDIACVKKIMQRTERLDYWKAYKTFCRENLDQWNC